MRKPKLGPSSIRENSLFYRCGNPGLGDLREAGRDNIVVFPVVTIHPNAVAKQPNLGAVVIPGAVLCPNYEVVNSVIHMYQEHWGEAMQDTISQGQTVLLRGPATPVPNLELLGCSLLPPGTPMQVVQGLAPSVTAQLPDGVIVRGITHPLMFSWDLNEQERQQTRKALAEQDRQKALDPQAWQNWQDKQRAFQEQQDKAAQDSKR